MCQTAAWRLLSRHESDVSKSSRDIPSCVPHDELSMAAYKHVQQELHPVILNHSLRVFIYAVSISEKEGLPWHESTLSRLSLLFVAAMFHDFGTVQSCNGPQRFEVEGADAAVAFLKSHGVSVEKAHEVWYQTHG